MDIIRFQIGKNVFERTFNGMDREAVFNMVKDYFKFYEQNTPKFVSARAWKFPRIELNGRQTTLTVSPNGNWYDDAKNEPVLFVFDDETRRHKYLDFIGSIQKLLSDIA